MLSLHVIVLISIFAASGFWVRHPTYDSFAAKRLIKVGHMNAGNVLSRRRFVRSARAKIRSRCLRAGAAVVAVFACTPTVAAEPAKQPDPIFADHSTLDVTISAPFTSIFDDRSIDKETSGKLKFANSEGEIVEFDVAIRSRGLFRRQADICRFPPLRLNFKKSQTKDTLFDKQDKVKIVTHCQNRSVRYEQTVVTEYLAYRILNYLTDTSFRVRLLRVTYVDTDKKNKEVEKFAVLIEHKDRLAKRIDEPALHVEEINIRHLQPAFTNLVSLFQYLIGNTDHSPIKGPSGEPCCHNYVPFGIEGQTIYSVPYDFDMSGFVYAPHAKPSPQFRIRSVTSRVYRGRCVNNALVPASLVRFQEQRDRIFALLREQPSLTDRTRKRVISYVEKFYKIIDNPKSVAKQLVKECI